MEELVRSIYGLKVLLLAAVWSGVSGTYSIQRRCSLVWWKCWVLWDLRLAVVYRQKGLATPLDEGRKWLCLCWAIDSSGGVASAIRARSVPGTCAARDSYTNELGLFLCGAGGSLIVFYPANALYHWAKEPLREAEPWAHVEKLIAARRDSSRRGGAAGTQAVPLSSAQPTQISLLGQARLGCCEPWPSVGYSWKADSAVILLSPTNTATAAILRLQCLAPWQSINQSSCFTFWALRGGVLAVYRLCLKNFMGQIDNFMGQIGNFMGQKAATVPIGNSIYFASVCIWIFLDWARMVSS